MQAFGAWIAITENRLRDSLRPFARQVDVEAVVQEALIRVWQVAPRFEPDGRPGALLRLAIRIARNLAVDELRRARLVPVGPEELARIAAADDGFTVPADPPRDPMLGRAIADCLSRMPEKPARALSARLESRGDEADAVLAARLRMRVNTFFQNISRARVFLAECLQQRGIEIPVGRG